MLGEILLGVRPVLARMPEIPCVFWGHGRLNEYDDDDDDPLLFGMATPLSALPVRSA